MKIELYHASKFGNGAKVAEEFRRLMMAKGIDVNIHHVKEVSPKDLPSADLYVFGSPTHFGRAVGSAVRFVKKIDVPAGTKYAVFATFSAGRPNKKTGQMPSEEEMARWRRTIPMLDERLKAKGMTKVAEMRVFVKPEDLKGPLEDDWRERVETFVAQILMPS
jgi:flavodoxin